MVIDTSVLVSILYSEKHSEWCADVLKRAKTELLMSTVNFAELAIIVMDRQPKTYQNSLDLVKEFAITFIAPDEEQAFFAALARHRFPLNLGDCFAYSLARTKDVSIATLDNDFKKTDCEILIP